MNKSILIIGVIGMLLFSTIPVTAQEYEDAIAYGFGEKYSDIKWRVDEDKLKKLLKLIKQGKKINIPYLYYGVHRSFTDHTNIIGDFSQEGHHRAIISDMIGKKKIPVMIAYPESKNYQKINIGIYAS